MRPKKGDEAFVSSAAGAVGLVAGQLLRLLPFATLAVVRHPGSGAPPWQWCATLAVVRHPGSGAPPWQWCSTLAVVQHPGSTLAAPWQHGGSTLAAPWQHPGSTLAAPWQY
eukprot:gene5657-9900_t